MVLSRNFDIFVSALDNQQSQIVFTRTLFGTHRKRTLGEIVYKLALYSVRLKRTCLVRLNSSLVLYLART